MSTSKIALPTYSFKAAVCPKKGGGLVTLPAFDSQGTQSYENGVWGYYRSLRFGQVIGFFNGEEIHFRIRQGGKIRAGLKVVGDKISFYKTGRQPIFRKGVTAVHYFQEAVEKLMLERETPAHPEREVISYLSFFCAHLLPQWDQPKEGVTFDDFWGFRFRPTWNKLLFPLLDFDSVHNSRTKAYKVLRGQKNLKSAAKDVFGNGGKHHTKLLTKWLGCESRADRINNVALLIKAGCPVEVASEVIDGTTYMPTNLVESLLKTVSLNRACEWLKGECDPYYYRDTAEMLSKFPGLQVGREIKDIRHLHDVLSYMVNHADDGDAHLWSHPEFRNYEGKEVGGYTIRFPDKISDIKYWGSHLSICVGSYGSCVNTGESIVFALYKDDKPVVCVEIEGRRHELRQVYGFGNSAQPPELSQALKKLMLSSPKKVLVDTKRQLVLERSEVDVNVLYKKAVYEIQRRR